MYHRNAQPSRGGKAQSRSRSFGNAPSRARFSRATGAGNFRKFAPKKAKLDISAFINKAAATAVVQEEFVAKHSFSDFKLSSALLQSIQKKGYTNPTAIQDGIIPSIMEGKDVVGLSNTGTGKTAAFLIPLIEKVLHNPQEQILIATPTRELAQQIQQELLYLARGMRVYSVTCVGGEHIGLQIRKLQNKSNFIIGTPGRLIDLVKRGNLRLDGVHNVVLDEADRMLDMGFINDIKFLMTHVPKDRQTLCFSATMSKTIDALVQSFLKTPITVSVRTNETPETIQQDVIRIRDLNKIDVLHDLLQDAEFKKVLVFGRTKRGVENLTHMLTKRGVRAESIHSDKTQVQRKRALVNFKENRIQVLTATDVAARGLHIDDVTHVINYEVPETYDDYIHRIGRTGRGTNKGKALTFVD